MKNSAVNPYLPLDEYVPDGEPRLFKDRLYIYGSHDTAGGNFFCLEDYVAWSAPQEDLSDWRYEGIIYRKKQDPSNPNGELELFAPDVVQGPDGRYYLYYCLRMVREFGVAVSDSPAGPFSFYGHVHYTDGTVLSEYMPYDPSVLVDDDGSVYLYYGFSSEMLAEKFNTEISPGAMVVQLEKNMLTAKTKPQMCVPWHKLAVGTSFEGHAYFEAPSMRKINNLYYLVYSSQWCRELCYAVSRYPNKGFAYGGVIVDNADVGTEGRTVPAYIPGNNHGGLIQVKNNTYIFYHRHTHGNSFSRQGCAEQVKILPDGKILQVPITSCGLNGGPLLAKGQFSAAIACHLTGAKPEVLWDFRNVSLAQIPYIYEAANQQGEKEQFICNMTDGCVAGYRYFCAQEVNAIYVKLRGQATGVLTVYTDACKAQAAGSCTITLHSQSWETYTLPCVLNDTYSLYFSFAGEGSFDFLNFTFTANEK
ncbi:MAG: family 43 glycosylhydrolase [Oscillospiraceae bacterium]|nr:family 43 glycosylhydrolase [Oscillospiraceae bacterium]